MKNDMNILQNHQEFTLTPRTEAKYNKIDEEFHLMMQRNQVNGVRVIIMMMKIMMIMKMMTTMITMMTTMITMTM